MQHRTSLGRTALALGTAFSLTFASNAHAQNDSADQGNPKTETILSIEGASPDESEGSSQRDDASSESSASGQSVQPNNQVGDTFELPRYSEDNQVELITGLCGMQMKDMSGEACRCLAEQSLDGLSDPQRDYLIASVVAPPVADRMISDGRVGDPDQVEIFGFLQTYSETCRTRTASTGGGTGSSGSATDGPSATSPASDREENQTGSGSSDTEGSSSSD